jgi:hypothetical protein
MHSRRFCKEETPRMVLQRRNSKHGSAKKKLHTKFCSSAEERPIPSSLNLMVR